MGGGVVVGRGCATRGGGCSSLQNEEEKTKEKRREEKRQETRGGASNERVTDNCKLHKQNETKQSIQTTKKRNEHVEVPTQPTTEQQWVSHGGGMCSFRRVKHLSQEVGRSEQATL